MNMRPKIALKPLILAVVVGIILISTAFFAAGYLHDKLVPPTDEITVTVTLEEIETEGLGGTTEHPHLPMNVVHGTEYDLGVRVVGLATDDGVKIYLSLTRTNISVDDVECLYYNALSSSWKPLYFVDQGDSLIATLGPTAGTDIYDGYVKLNRLILSFDIDGSYVIDCWAESG